MGASVADRLGRAAPGIPLATGDDAAAWSAAGHVPDAVVAPPDVDALAAVLATASEEGWAVLPAGAGTWLDAGDPPRVDGRPLVVVATARLREVVEYEPANLTATVEAGIGLRSLQALCRKRGQYVAVDPPGSARSTVGAVVATASDGPLRLYHGTLRNHVLGITLVTGDGRVLGLGGRVVKNVAGYDLVKPAVGSWGTLGVVAGVTLRLHPVPELDRTLVFAGDGPGGAVARGRAVATGRREPAALAVLSPGAADGIGAGRLAGGERWTVAVRLQGARPAVEALGRDVAAAVGEEPEASADGDGSRGFWEGVAAPEDGARCLIRARSLPAGLGDTLEAVLDAGPGGVARVVAGPGTGIVRASLVDAPDRRERLAGALRELRGELEGRGGSLAVLRAPGPVMEEAGAWGDPGPAGRLMRELGERFDPAGVLNPGRYVV